jgi:hypothetical protein
VNPIISTFAELLGGWMGVFGGIMILPYASADFFKRGLMPGLAVVLAIFGTVAAVAVLKKFSFGVNLKRRHASSFFSVYGDTIVKVLIGVILGQVANYVITGLSK